MGKKETTEGADSGQATGSVVKVTKGSGKAKKPAKTVKEKKDTAPQKEVKIEKPVHTPQMDPPGLVVQPTLLTDKDMEHLSSKYTTDHPANTKLEFGDEMKKIILTGGTLELTVAQNKQLYADFEDADVSMKPDGTIYLPWIKYSGRLTQTFGGTGWVLIPEGMPKENNNIVYWGFHLVIKGVYCGFSIGEQQYFNNGRMTYGEACEGAKSNALTRLCKGLGIGIKLWDKGYSEGWLEKYAVFNWEDGQNGGKRKKVYRLKNTAEAGPQKTHQGPVANHNNDEPVKKNTSDHHHKRTPVQPKDEFEQERGMSLVQMFENKLRQAASMQALQNEYHQVKLAWNNGAGTITTPEKEKLRILANELASKFDAAN